MATPDEMAIGPCDIRTPIGRGGMAAVYLGHHRFLDIPVAVKVLDPELTKSHPTAAARFLREARAAARIDHPNVVRVYDCGEDEGVIYLVMEHVDGPSLSKLLEDGPLPVRRALAIAKEVALALGALWATGIVHRDIKPSNVLLTADGRVKLADLGLAKDPQQEPKNKLTRTGQLLGTPHYMSPEQLMEARTVDVRSDIYSLGVMLFEMVEGQRPFEGGLLDVAEQHLQAPRPALGAGQLPQLQRLIRNMMAVSVDDRPAEPAALVHLIDGVSFQLEKLEGADTLYEEEEEEEPPRTRPLMPGEGEPAQPTIPERPAVSKTQDATVPLHRLPPRAPEPLGPTPIPAPSPDGASSSPPKLVIVAFAAVVTVATVAAGLFVLGRSGLESATTPVEEPSKPRPHEERGPVEPHTPAALHARVKDLGEGRVRLHYDFETAAQLEDWEAVEPGERMHVAIEEGRLHVNWVGEADVPLAVVLHRRPMRVDVLEVLAEVVRGDHINWYLQTQWTPEQWCPPKGYAGIFRDGGRLFCIDGKETEEKEPPVRVGQAYRMRVEAADDHLAWHVEGMDHHAAPIEAYQRPDRRFGLGSWAGHVMFDEIIIEGQLSE